MQAIKFTFVDLLKSKVQILTLLIIAVIQLWMMKMTSSPLSGIIYMFFGGIIISVQPFIQEQTAEVGFVNMLPGTKGSRVLGRYLFGLLINLIAVLASIINLNIYSIYSHEFPQFAWEGILFSFSITLLFCSFQYILFYVLGKIKSQQLAGILMMLPGFVMFFGVNFLIDSMKSRAFLTQEWMIQNGSSIILALFLISVISFVFGIYSSTIIAKKKDYI